MRTSGHPLSLLVLILSAPIALGEPPGPAAQTPSAAAMTAEDAARWNDRSTPRKTLETFYFAISGYDLAPALIGNAIDCLDLTGLDPAMRERDAALLAHQLEAILNRLSIPLYGVPDRPDGDRVELEEVGGLPIVLTRQEDGRWRFDAATVGRIGRMRALAARGQRAADEARSKLAEGRTDPATTIRSFASAAMGRHDFALAARCLDLRDIPPMLRAAEGAAAARKLAFVMQRCAFLFIQEVPSDSEGYRFTWHSNHRGRILLERVRLPEGQDAWLFSRGTLRNLDALVEGFRPKPPDPRYTQLGVVIGEEVLTAGRQPQLPPPNVPPALGSPRKVLRTFVEAMDALEFDHERVQDLLACLDLSGLPEEDRAGLGLRLATKLESILQETGVDLLAVPDIWEADPLTLGHDADEQVTLARGLDGAWRFDRETVARVPELFEHLTPEQKTARERRSNFHSARQTMRTLLHAVGAGNLDLAARCLDLDGIPPAARDELGPILAYKLKFVLDRIGRVVVEEMPDEADGPRFYFYRGPLGRIDLARSDEASRRGEWQFSSETVARVEEMFREAVDQPVAPTLTPKAAPSLALTPSLWLRFRLPGWLRLRAPGLDLYQWLGLVLALAASGAASWLGLQVAERLVCRLLRVFRVEVDRELAAPKLRPLALQLGLWCLYLQLRLLDLPADVVGAAIPALKVAWVGLIGWTALRLIDLGMILYAGSERLHDRRGLSDMVVPTASNGLKLAVLLATVSGQVYLVGNGETLTRLLAGLGLVGLAASLAAQDTLKNLFGTLLLIGEHPFRLGDHVVIQGTEGVVESVGFRSTRIRTFEESVVTIPNSVMATALIDNRGARTSRRYRTTVALAYGTPVERLVALRDTLRGYAAGHPKARADRVEVHLSELGASGVDLLVQVYFRVATFAEEMACRDEFIREVLRQAERLGVEVAFPTRTIHLAGAAAGGHEVPPPPRLLVRGHSEDQRVSDRPRADTRLES